MLRHAHAGHASEDHARRLDERGRDEARRVGERLYQRGWVPEMVLASDSARTRETWKIVAAELHRSGVEARFSRSLYTSGRAALPEAASDIDIGMHTAMAIGHNPDFEELCSVLCGHTITLAPANAALLTVDAAAWDEALVLDGSWQLEDILHGNADD